MKSNIRFNKAFLRNLIKYALISILLTLNMNCAPQTSVDQISTMSIEEAKKVTTSIRAQGFTPPPRNIYDITLILSQKKPDDLEDYKRAIALADSKPPVTSDNLELANFYLKRGHAAHNVGRTNQEIEDYKLAVKFGGTGDFFCKEAAKWSLSSAEMRSGNLTQGITILKDLISESDNAILKSSYNAILSTIYTDMGNIPNAKKTLAKAEQYRDAIAKRKKLKKRYLALMDCNIDNARGTLLTSMGLLAKGEIYHRKAVAEHAPYKNAVPGACFSSKGNIRLRVGLISKLSANLRIQGRLVEAEMHARRAVHEAIQSYGIYAAHTGQVVTELNRVIFEQGRFSEAEALARTNLEIYWRFKAARDSALLANAHSILADAILAQRRWEEALTEYEAIKEALQTDPAVFKGMISTNINFWIALIKSSRGHDAIQYVQPAYKEKKNRFGEEHYNTAETRGILAMNLAALDKKERSLHEFSKAVPVLLQHSIRPGAGRESITARQFRFFLILDSYIQLLAEIHGTTTETKIGIDASAIAFRMADVVRSQKVKLALAASSTRAAAKDSALADLARREQDAMTQIGALNSLLSNVLSEPDEQQDSDVIKDLLNRINRLRSAQAALMKEIKARFPEYTDLIDPKPGTIEEVQSNLKPGEALLATHVGEDITCAWAIPTKRMVAFASAKAGSKEIAKRVSDLRRSLDIRASILQDIPDFDLGTGYWLYKTLLKPVEEGWKEATDLIIVTHGALGELPFSLLPTASVSLENGSEKLFSNHKNVPWLIKKVSISRQPSVASLLTLRKLTENKANRKAFIGFGDPLFNEMHVAEVAEEKKSKEVRLSHRMVGFSIRRTRGIEKGDLGSHKVSSSQLSLLRRLPDTAAEIKQIAATLDANPLEDIFLHQNATEYNVKNKELANRRIIAFASHALLPGDLDGLDQPAIALCSPEVTNDNEDGLLTMGEILGLQLNADWVVLSACNTGAGDGAGAEAVSGLGRAFFYAGTRALLVSMWPVETTSAMKLTTELFKYQKEDKTISRAQALRKSILDLIDNPGLKDGTSGVIICSYAHPFFWAPFILVGDNGAQ